MLVASLVGFGGFREDVVGTLGPILGTTRVTTFIDSLETEIRRQAKAGAEAAIPRIRAEAESGAREAIPDITLQVQHQAREAVKPLVFSAIAAGALGLAVGGWALWRSFR
jgi:hypothetical protein